MKQNSFSKEERLKKSDLIKKVLDEGILFRGKFVNVYIFKQERYPEIKRAAFTVRKKLHCKKAVLRNRFRRILREAYRKTKNLLSGSYDIVILGVNIKESTKSFIIEEELAYVFKKFSAKSH
jgi:ribonuclease P protein component